MAIINAVSVLSSAFCIYLFVVIRRIKVREHAHAALLILTVALVQWNVTAYFVYTATDINVLLWLLPASCIGMFVYFGAQLHFAFALVRRRAAPAWLLAVIYGPAIVLAALHFVAPFTLEATVASDGVVQLQRAASGPIHPFWLTYSAACWLIPIAFYIRRYRTATLNRVRMQSRLLIRAILIVFVLVWSEYYVPILVPGWEIPSLSPVLMSIWVGAMVYAIWKYGFLRISPRLLTEEILDSIEDLVLLYDLEGNRVYENHKANTVLGSGKALALFSPDPLREPVTRLLQGAGSWRKGEPERRLRVRVPDAPVAPERWFTIEGRVKPVFDTFDDPLGLLVSGSVVPQESEHPNNFHFTDREAEVLEFLLAGWTIGRTARALHITERTVKAHITNIYEKTGAANRVELMNVLSLSHTPIRHALDSE